MREPAVLIIRPGSVVTVMCVRNKLRPATQDNVKTVQKLPRWSWTL